MDFDRNIRQSPKTTLTTITILHLALTAGPLLFGIVVFSLSSGRAETAITASNQVFIYLCFFLAAVCILLSRFIYKQQIGGLIGKATLQEKITGYQTAIIVSCALLEAPALFGDVVYFLTGNIIPLAIAALLIVYLFMLRPTKDKIVNDLELSMDEEIAFDGKEPII